MSIVEIKTPIPESEKKIRKIFRLSSKSNRNGSDYGVFGFDAYRIILEQMCVCVFAIVL